MDYKDKIHFYPRPPRGGRHITIAVRVRDALFLSTPSARRATRTTRASESVYRNFYPRPPRGGRPTQLSDYLITTQFLSTPSARRATIQDRPETPKGGISIHALREEGDVNVILHFGHLIHFYPRPPRGGRPAGTCPLYRDFDFYPRPPRGGRRRVSFGTSPPGAISIHALREEGDSTSGA